MSRAPLPQMVAAARTVNSLAGGVRHVSKRLLASYIFDWVLILYVSRPETLYGTFTGRAAGTKTQTNFVFTEARRLLAVASAGLMVLDMPSHYKTQTSRSLTMKTLYQWAS